MAVTPTDDTPRRYHASRALRHLAISDSSEPNRAAVEDCLCDITQWIDTTLAWRYVVPVTDARDRELLRPIGTALAA